MFRATGAEAEDSKELLLRDGTGLDIVGGFCCLGDMVGGAECASGARVRCDWRKFNELAPMLALRLISGKGRFITAVSEVPWLTVVRHG